MEKLLTTIMMLFTEYVCKPTSTFRPKILCYRYTDERHGCLFHVELQEVACSDVRIRSSAELIVKTALYIDLYARQHANMIDIQDTDRSYTMELKFAEDIDLTLAEALVRKRLETLYENRGNYEYR